MDTSVYTVLSFIAGILFGLISGVVGGWFLADKYTELVQSKLHDFEELFNENPHPEIYDKEGKIHRGDYMAISFDLGYDPEDFNPEDITRS